MSKTREHWENVYRNKGERAVSWYREHLDTSLQLLERAGLQASSRIIDIGAGASTLVDDLLARGLRSICVVDLSAEALEVARRRLGDLGRSVTWLAADITQASLPPGEFDFWHDRALLHFLTTDADAASYVASATRALRPGGHAVIGGFASDGPMQCSGLPVARRDAGDIAALFGAGFELVDQAKEQHTTPAGAVQRFAYAVLRKRS